MTESDRTPPDQRAATPPAGAGALRGQADHRRPGRPAGADDRRAARPRPPPRRGVPGLAKTMAIKTLADVIGGEFQRIQFTPDLVPADLVGTRIYNQRDGEFQVSLGPVFANLVLADEINRAPAKVQSALLEVMQERQVTIGRRPSPRPTRSSSWPPRTRSSPRAPTSCPRRRSTGSCSRCSSGTLAARGVRRRRADDRGARRDAAGALGGLAAGVPAAGRPGLRRPRGHRVCGPPRQRDPQPGDRRQGRAGAVPHLRQPARLDQHGARRSRARLPPRAGVRLATDVRDLARDVLRHRIVLSYEALAEDMSDDLLTPILAATPSRRLRCGRADRTPVCPRLLLPG